MSAWLSVSKSTLTGDSNDEKIIPAEIINPKRYSTINFSMKVSVSVKFKHERMCLVGIRFAAKESSLLIEDPCC